MKLVTINNALLLKYTGDSEVLQKSTRPYVLVVRLKYKDACYDFAVPIRSNIPASAPKDQYFALPPRPQTRPKNRHGLHYIKNVSRYKAVSCSLPHGGKQLRNIDSRHYREKQQTNR